MVMDVDRRGKYSGPTASLGFVLGAMVEGLLHGDECPEFTETRVYLHSRSTDRPKVDALESRDWGS